MWPLMHVLFTDVHAIDPCICELENFKNQNKDAGIQKNKTETWETWLALESNSIEFYMLLKESRRHLSFSAHIKVKHWILTDTHLIRFSENLVYYIFFMKNIDKNFTAPHNNCPWMTYDNSGMCPLFPFELIYRMRIWIKPILSSSLREFIYLILLLTQESLQMDNYFWDNILTVSWAQWN
jgi:hypothetical protein